MKVITFVTKRGHIFNKPFEKKWRTGSAFGGNEEPQADAVSFDDAIQHLYNNLGLKEYDLNKYYGNQICKICNVEKPVSEFHVNNIKGDGRGKYYTAECKIGRNPINRYYYDQNKEKLNEKKREKITCACGCIVSRGSCYRHRKSQQHMRIQPK